MMIETLTPREQQIADAAAQGLTNRQIAAQFGISTETVKRHLSSIYGKLAMPGRVMLAIHVARSTVADRTASTEKSVAALRPAHQ